MAISSSLNLGGTGGSPLPLPDIQGGLHVAMTGGRLALVQSTTPLRCDKATPTMDRGVMDIVGYGSSAVHFEGNGPAPTPTNKNALFRLNARCTDMNTNGTVFTPAVSAPRNSSTPAVPCS